MRPCVKFKGMYVLWSISLTFYVRLFCTKVSLAAFLYILDLYFFGARIFAQMLVKLTPVLQSNFLECVRMKKKKEYSRRRVVDSLCFSTVSASFFNRVSQKKYFQLTFLTRIHNRVFCCFYNAKYFLVIIYLF